MPRTHNRAHFFKYTSLSTARQVIQTKSFRWSSPLKFNDPFDHQAGFVLGFNRDEFAEHFAKSVESIIFSECSPTLKPASIFSSLILHMRSIRKRLPRDQFIAQLRNGCKESAERLFDGGMETLNATIQKHLTHSRVFCVSELHDNVVMWSHYADEHQGVVFKIVCHDEIDNSLCVARPVRYSDSFPLFPSAESYARHLAGVEVIDFAPLILDLAFTKHIDWAYEKEWRVHIPLLQQQAGDGYSAFPEDPRVFEAIYLGCRMGDREVVDTVSFIGKHLPATKIYRGKKSAAAFKLTFEELIHG